MWGEDAQEFNPERFLDAEGRFRNPHPDSFAPFSVGRRHCPGAVLAEQEMFLFLTGLLGRYRVERVEGTDLPEYRFDLDDDNIGFIRHAPDYQLVLRRKTQK